ncbi:MAG: alpha-amylase family protein [Dermatophilus congolensis]|nr:alpha-amylase family protein [Dermatophilus congolensis]
MSLIDTIWWHVYPLGAAGAPIRDHDGGLEHRLGRLEPWLDYASEMGCTGLLLGPVFASATHGYDTLDHFRLDPRLGDEGDWERFVAAARERGLAIMLDGVFNHVGVGHPAVHESLQAGGGLVRVRDGHTFAWEGFGDLAELDHDNPAVADLVYSVMCHWLERGASGWRLDVAYAVPTWFWANVIGRVRERFPEAVFVGEVIHGDYPAFVQSSAVDSVTQYQLWKAIWSSINDTNFWELSAALERHDRFMPAFVPLTFVGNHDVTRIANQIGDTGAALAAITLLTLPGMPSIYYGDEQAFRGVKRTDGPWADDDLRPRLPDIPAELAPFGWWLYDLHRDLIRLRKANPWITRGQVTVTGKDTTWITYEVSGEGHRLAAELRLTPTPSARVTVDGGEVFTWASTHASDAGEPVLTT